jgi:3-oxoadipate enol-lactonase
MNFIELNGTALRYELSGSGERAVVLIHEMGGTLESWDGAAPLLAKRSRVLRYDTRGAGLSQKVRGALSIDTMTDDLIALMDAARIAKAAVAGVAVGGAIALHTALRYPARVSAVVATSPAIAVASDRRAAVLARVERIEREGMAVAVDESFASGYPTELRSDMARFNAFRARWLGNDPASYATIYRMLAATDLTASLPASNARRS